MTLEIDELNRFLVFMALAHLFFYCVLRASVLSFGVNATLKWLAIVLCTLVIPSIIYGEIVNWW
ncbi:MAG: hypothetical protein EOO88_21820 [Pedobacter sp.]|nr:MAG: hypothetical protein EOO88_21820 [Pedobacter sp.]